jgi:hypothetical protein
MKSCWVLSPLCVISTGVKELGDVSFNVEAYEDIEMLLGIITIMYNKY